VKHIPPLWVLRRLLGNLEDFEEIFSLNVLLPKTRFPTLATFYAAAHEESTEFRWAFRSPRCVILPAMLPF